jgi:rhodanese-related sulfurtransferase
VLRGVIPLIFGRPKKKVVNPLQKITLAGFHLVIQPTGDGCVMIFWRNTLAEAALVMLMALLLAGAGLIFRPELRSLLGGGQPAAESAYPGLAKASISLDEARAYFKDGTALFADARPWNAYKAGHIPGAMSLDPDAFDTWSGNFFSQFPADTLIVTYCDGARCPLSLELAKMLMSLGYEKVLVFKDGWMAWDAAHLPKEQVAQ